MARLFSLMHAGAIDDPGFGHFDISKDHGGFDLPDELSDRLHGMHYRGRPMWETEAERNDRLHGEETARRRDPETMYGAVEGISALLEKLAGLQVTGNPAPSPQVEALSKQVEELTARLGEMQAAQAAGGSGGEAAAGKTPARSGGKTAAK